MALWVYPGIGERDALSCSFETPLQMRVWHRSLQIVLYHNIPSEARRYVKGDLYRMGPG